ncbi:MAG: aminotransferase class V-fold PLP-dependent enzyme [Spirochaetes bacterium]|nr:aminotransferase class V-fold PLP-dependent enzyme [Spirochaetota bacterium]
MGARVVYLDNAATSWPKPPCVAEAMAAFLRDSGGNPGRSGHRLSVAAGRVVAEAREAAARALGLSDPLRLAFTANATAALNVGIAGLAGPGDRIVVDAMAHNACARPLSEAARRGAEIDWAPVDGAGRLDLDLLEDLVAGRRGPGGGPGRGARVGRKAARLVVLTHGSNVSGALQDLAAVATIAELAGAVLLVDAAQTAGLEDIGLDSLPGAVVAFTGHKAMLGPGGTGGLAFGTGVDPEACAPLLRGGTGSASESEEHPAFMPDRFEAGTLNGPGLAGLLSGLSWIEASGRAELRAAELRLTERLAAGLRELPGVQVLGPRPGERRCPVLSIRAGLIDPASLALALDERHGVLCRVGLHCAPRAHRSLGTFPGGAVRLSPGPFLSDDDIDYALGAVEACLKEGTSP